MTDQQPDRGDGRYWIHAPSADETRLKDCGVILGEYRDGDFNNCQISEAAFAMIDRFWGEWIWGPEESEPFDAR